VSAPNTKAKASKQALPNTFADRLLAWQEAHGRHHLPWQSNADPYRVWLSEIMLQQTQVASVLDYFARFTQKFPTLQDLAQAPLSDVLGLWSGLGYYTRARNLHKAAQMVQGEFGGQFPPSSAELVKLPGIGPSTAAAIASICFHERVSILDGNAKRLLARHLGFSEDLSQNAAQKRLQTLANAQVPKLAQDMPRYTQSLMDVGAMLCTQRKPKCEACPVSTDCQARLTDRVEALPIKTRKVKRSQLRMHFLLRYTAGLAAGPNIPHDNGGTGIEAVYLEQRPAKGIWAQLLCPPCFDTEDALRSGLTPQEQQRLQTMNSFQHVLTHKDLIIQAHWLRDEKASISSTNSTNSANSTHRSNSPPNQGQWYAINQSKELALPVPVRKLLFS
jgi:A/G-specific adenine glycosylase